MVRPIARPMPKASRGGGNLGVSDGGKPVKKAGPYSPPKGPIQSGKPQNHGTSGTQGKR